MLRAWQRASPKIPTLMDFHSALRAIRDVLAGKSDVLRLMKEQTLSILVVTSIDMYEPRKRLDSGNLGV